MTSLNGARILVTRPEHQADRLCQLIADQGGEAIRFPTLAIVGHEDSAGIQKRLANLAKFQWLVFISANAVNFAVKANGGKIRHHSALRFVAIGSATAQAMQAAGLAVDLMPTEGQNSEALLAMNAMQAIAGQHFLLVRGVGGREDLAETLRARGADVEYLEVYKRIIPHIGNSGVPVLLATGQVDVVTVTSVETLKNLLVMVGAAAKQQLLETPLVVMSDRIRGCAVEMGFRQVVVTQSPSDAAMLETVTTMVTGG
jgi:uroporphyrinogen-III synthase